MQGVATATRRITKELKSLQDDPIDGVTAEPKEDDLLNWEGSIKGASNTPYKNGTFKFTIEFPKDFPFKPPKVTFTTKIYHPGINEEGQICIPVLRDEWKPAMNISKVLSLIQEKLNNPSPDDPFEPEIAKILKEDPTKFNAQAKEWTKKYAT